MSSLAEKLLHTSYYSRSGDLGAKGMVEKQLFSGTKHRCVVCNYVHEGELPDDFICPICGVGTDKFVPE